MNIYANHLPREGNKQHVNNAFFLFNSYHIKLVLSEKDTSDNTHLKDISKTF